MVSVIVLVHNGFEHVRRLFSYRPTDGVETQWIVLDNASAAETAGYLSTVPEIQLLRSETNLYFAQGNNLALQQAKGEQVCLLNSDVAIVHSDWLARLMHIHRCGITAYGVCDSVPIRADGFCCLIDRNLCRLDERFEWWWSVTKLQADLLRKGYCVQAVRHFDAITHFGGGSGPVRRGLAGANTPRTTVAKWFAGLPAVKIIERL